MHHIVLPLFVVLHLEFTPARATPPALFAAQGAVVAFLCRGVRSSIPIPYFSRMPYSNFEFQRIANFSFARFNVFHFDVFESYVATSYTLQYSADVLYNSTLQRIPAFLRVSTYCSVA